MLSNYRDIIKAPVITEKSSNIASNDRKYVFKVDAKANKSQIKDAIEKIFKVILLMFILRKRELDVIVVWQTNIRKQSLL